ncbi:hypothetical protein E4U55_002716 [Claviceps digitariae]|nr:hypothetical protein E4U55_002716 [Claviceps digitariae]
MADCPVTAAWAASFCLGCDANAQVDQNYCSEECFLRESRLSDSRTPYHRLDDPETSLPFRLLSRLGLVAGQTSRQLGLSPPATSTDEPFSGMEPAQEHRLAGAEPSTQTSRFCEHDARWAESQTTRTSGQQVPQKQCYNTIWRTSNHTASGYSNELFKTDRLRFHAISRLYDGPMSSERRHGSAMQWDMWRQRRTSMALGLDDLVVLVSSDNSPGT